MVQARVTGKGACARIRARVLSLSGSKVKGLALGSDPLTFEPDTKTIIIITLVLALVPAPSPLNRMSSSVESQASSGPDTQGTTGEAEEHSSIG